MGVQAVLRRSHEESPLSSYVTTRLRFGYDARNCEVRVIVANLLNRAHDTFRTFNSTRAREASSTDFSRRASHAAWR